MQLRVASLPGKSCAFTNNVYVAPDTFAHLTAKGREDQEYYAAYGIMVTVCGFAYACRPMRSVESGTIALGSPQRRTMTLSLNQGVDIDVFTPPTHNFVLSSISVEADIATMRKKTEPVSIDVPQLSKVFHDVYANQPFQIGQEFPMEFAGTTLALKITSLTPAAIGDAPAQKCRVGQLVRACDVVFSKPNGSVLRLTGADNGGAGNQIFRPDFDFSKLKIGGLDGEFSAIFRRAFASRMFPSRVVSAMGITHVRGMLLFGPPGCGKTLIARQIGKVLNARPPKIVNGPEVLNKFVGQSEENIRELFADAEEEQQQAGDGSGLHIIIFDELDSICKTRGVGRADAGTGDSIVNQLLAKLDGVDSLNNILLIGMTNRKDMIDEALLRPGRLEVHVEIGLPDQRGREQILTIHTADMREHGHLSQTVANSLPQLAERTKNFSGAEIEGLVRSAASYAFHRKVDLNHLDKKVEKESVVVEQEDFDLALSEVTPAFGANSTQLKACFRNGITSYGPVFTQLQTTLRGLVEQVRSSDRTPLLSVLLEGEAGTGTTALAAATASEAGFPFVRLVTADSLIGYAEGGSHQSGACNKAFQDAYKSPLSLLILDDLERLLEYVPIGPRFSNPVLQALLVLLKKAPPTEGRRLLVLATSSAADHLAQLGLTQCFDVTLHVPSLASGPEVAAVLAEGGGGGMSAAAATAISKRLTQSIGVKKLLMVAEMAREAAGGADVTPDRFLECLHNCGFD